MHPMTVSNQKTSSAGYLTGKHCIFRVKLKFFAVAGIFSGLLNSRNKFRNLTSGSNYASFFDGTTAGKAVTGRSTMQMSYEMAE